MTPGFKRDGVVGMANTDPACLELFVTWLRRCFGIDETRLRVRLYLHEDLDIEAAQAYWSSALGVPTTSSGGRIGRWQIRHAVGRSTRWGVHR